MIEGVIIKKIQKNADQRGWLAEIWRSDGADYQPTMGYISLTEPGETRGPHEHRQQTDYFIFLGIGSFEVYLWDRRESSETNGEQAKIKSNQEELTLIVVPPGVVHGYKCVSGTAGWCLNLPDKLYKGQGKSEEVDEIRWEDDENSPYKIN